MDAWITFPKLLLIGVNGPAIGIPCTTLPLADSAYCSTTATFQTPFVALGQSPEAASSVTFPRLMGHGAAAEVLLMGKQLSAQEALERRLVAGVFSPEQLMGVLQSAAKTAASLPQGSLISSKSILRQGMGLDMLRRANEAECALLRERWASEECQQAIMAFMSRKQK